MQRRAAILPSAMTSRGITLKTKDSLTRWLLCPFIRIRIKDQTMPIILAAAWLCLPLVPLNPIEEDTLSSWNLHVTLGASSPNHFVSSGPDLTVKCEKLAIHPLVIRSALEYQLGRTNSEKYFDGYAHQGTLSLCALYYRGTNKLTGYLGGGPVIRFGHLALSSGAKDSLWSNQSVTDVNIKPSFGYRIVLGLRYLKTISLEIGITEVIADIQYLEDLGPTNFAIRSREANLGSVRVTLGYIWTLKD
jgi:hypothetical protein